MHLCVFRPQPGQGVTTRCDVDGSEIRGVECHHHCDELDHHGARLPGAALDRGASLSPSYIKGDDMKALEEQRSRLNGVKVRSQL
ncbi:unnamed protein product [Boreogadus saida]